MRTFLITLLVATASAGSAQSLNRIVYFDSGKSELAPKDAAWLDSVASFLKTTATYSVTIKAYCDAVGSDEMNRALAERRMEAVKAILAKEIDAGKIIGNAFGENDPVAGNETEAGKAKNRRAAIDITYRQSKKADIVAAQPAPATIQKVLDDTPAPLSEAKLEVGKRIVLKNMNFEGGTAVLLPESEPVLKELLKLMQDNPTLEIEIGGHVCCGPDMPLSILRAKKVYTYLAGYGISQKRMTYKGYSFDRPLTPDITPRDKDLNRRVEITVLKL